MGWLDRSNVDRRRPAALEGYPDELPMADLPAEASDEDARQVMTLALATTQRERAFADQTYVRARQLVITAGTLYGAAQAAVIASVGRQSGDVVLLSGVEMKVLGVVAFASTVTFLLSVVWLFLRSDRPQGVPGASAHALAQTWSRHEPDGDLHMSERLAALAMRDLHEMTKANIVRRAAVEQLARFVLVCGSACLVQLLTLYIFLAT